MHQSTRLPFSLPPPLPTASLPSPLPAISLLRLSFAQSRKDIRWRKEGFEMTSSDADNIPFALRTHTLVPLDIAYARNDIRRRDEAFESRIFPMDVVSPRKHISTSTSLLSASLSCPTIDDQMTLPSIYSLPSFTLDDSILAVYEVYSALSLYELGYMVAADCEVAVDVSAHSDTFDGESFLRMVERSLGW